MSKTPSKINKWWQASRYHFIPPSIFPVCIGALVSWAEHDVLSVWYLFLVLIAVVVNHIALNMTDDYFDYKHSVDNLKPGEKNPYTGGSGTLTSGLIQPKDMFKVFIILYIITICIGVYFIIVRGVMILLFGLIGMFSSIFYTSPPIKFSHHGFGELGLLINFGIVLGLGSFFVQMQTITIEAFFATIPCGIMLSSMIIINEIPDIEDDKRAGKLTLIARYGNNFGMKLYIVSWICTYLIILIGMLFEYLPIFMIITFSTIPLTYRSITILKKHNQNIIKMAPANLDMIRSHSFTCSLIIIAYFIQGYINGSNLTNFLLFIIIFTLFYFPAGVVIFKKSK
jgi:1,4-dihydroxy-2-naphthoate octaprenyltransferase